MNFLRNLYLNVKKFSLTVGGFWSCRVPSRPKYLQGLVSPFPISLPTQLQRTNKLNDRVHRICIVMISLWSSSINHLRAKSRPNLQISRPKTKKSRPGQETNGELNVVEMDAKPTQRCDNIIRYDTRIEWLVKEFLRFLKNIQQKSLTN